MKTIDFKYLNALVLTIKYLPVITHIIILINIIEMKITTINITNLIYSYIGYSEAYVILLWLLSHVFKFCLWHRLLLYNMAINIFMEWICANFNIDIIANNLLSISSLTFTLFTLWAVVSFRITGAIKSDSIINICKNR